MKIEIEKPVVPEWFDEWYIHMKDIGYKDDQILLVVSPIYNYGSYSEFKAVNGVFDEDEYHYISENYLSIINAIQFGYSVEPDPLYYAKIKGWKHIGTSTYYFGYDEDKDSFEVMYLESNYRFAFSLTKEHWNKLGINDSNADFEKVEG